MKVLVTGGCGFMGSHFIKQIIDKHEVVCVDKMTYAGNIKNLEGHMDKLKHFYPFNIATLTPDFFDLGKFDVVANFAAETHVDRSIRDPKAFLETDVMGLFNLVYHSMKAGIKKFVHISTDEVYGPIPCDSAQYMKLISGEFIDQADETFPLNPTSPYSASKASGDLLLQAYRKTYNFPVVIVRPCNNYGPNQYPEKLIPMAITRLLQDKKVILHGEGKEVREWIYVEDCVKAIEAIMDYGKIGEIYNLGSGDRKTNRNVVQKIIIEMELGYWGNSVEEVSNRPGNDQRYAINSSKLVDFMGWDSDYFYINDFEEGLEKTIKWYKDNEGWWNNVSLDDNVYKDNEEYLR